MSNLMHRFLIQSVPPATEPGISLIILTPMKILQRNLNRSAFVVWEMKRNMSVVRFKFRCNILISGKIIKEMPGSVASGTPCTFITILYMYMFRAISCSSSGGQIVLIQHLVSSLSVSDRPVHRLREREREREKRCVIVTFPMSYV
jgi:hypothetical protein